MVAVLAGARRSRAQWQALIERAERSPLSVSAFCAAQGVSTASFYLWRKRLRAEASPEPAAGAGVAAGEFLDLGALAAPAGEAGERARGWDLELTLGGGLVLRLRRP